MKSFFAIINIPYVLLPSQYKTRICVLRVVRADNLEPTYLWINLIVYVRRRNSLVTRNISEWEKSTLRRKDWLQDLCWLDVFFVLLGAVSFVSSPRSSLLTPWILRGYLFIRHLIVIKIPYLRMYNNIKLNSYCKYFHHFLFIWETKWRYCIRFCLIANLTDIFKSIFLNFACNLREPPFNKLLILIGLVPCGNVCTSISFIKNKDQIIKWN